MHLSGPYKRIVFYLVAFLIVICLFWMLPTVGVDLSNVVIRNAEDSITHDHIFYSLEAEGIKVMTFGSPNNDVLYIVVRNSQFEDAIGIVESIAQNSSTIKILGFDDRGDLCVDRGLGDAFSTVPGQKIDLAIDIPNRFQDLVVAINREFPDSEMTNDNLAITRFAVSKRRYLSSSGAYATGFDVTVDALRSDQSTVSTTYQLTDALTNVRIISTKNTE